MLKGKNLIGMPVIIAGSGAQIQRVEGIVLDGSETHVTALVVDRNERCREARILPLHEVQSFRDEDIAVSSENVIHHVNQIPNIRRLLKQDSSLAGTRLITRDGTDVGTVADVIFNENTGSIDCFESFNESIADSLFRRSSLSLYDELDHGAIIHAAVVSQLARQTPRFDRYTEIGESTGELMRAGEFPEVECGGIPNSNFSRTKFDRMDQKKGFFGHRIIDWIGDYIKSWSLEISHRRSRRLEQRRIKAMLGYRAKFAVVDFNGVIVIDRGDVVTPATIRHAQEAEVFEELIGAIRGDAAELKPNSESKSTNYFFDNWFPPLI